MKGGGFPLSGYKALLFDLDDTLLDRDLAVEKIFSIIVDKYYGDVHHLQRNEMLEKFKEYDKRDYGNGDKTNVLESLFAEFPPNNRLPASSIQNFWNTYFPNCFSIDQTTINMLDTMKQLQVKVGIITNGLTQRQNAKIRNTHLNHWFDTVIISEEVGLRKPDKRIFELALQRLQVLPEEALFVGDDIEKDIGGCQNANIKGIWFNPKRCKNGTEIEPFAEMDSIARLVNYFT
ncbi:HAD-IA family hydrolase [Caldibacillus lycopersici]|uniref:HAD-IA family hydrolase n=1 Tax=Perspicuibacillus lycopersici TaxID=1325689 RepID=A0AAE3ITC4_9BACI|nr:HAD-IA family hydrolase [Perspicuibacillus lycopersici]MCU9613086.1 HAD-IA family hydrolase [Perspicuibacillus lycopersici]